ncbi:MAG: thioredoxin [Cyanobacteria bacterium RI_101]|nr:thioredoxin [Cyanobacteria bacterium RI_101]
MIAVNDATFSDLVLNAPCPVLVYFWAPWCGLCRFVGPLLSQLQDNCGGRLQLVAINADANLRLASAYQLTSLPTLILFKSGRILHRLDQFQTREDLEKIHQQISPAQFL